MANRRLLPVDTSTLICLASLVLVGTSCGFDWSLPEPAQATGSGGSGAGGSPAGGSGGGGAGGTSIDACTTCANREILEACSADWSACQAADGCVQLTTCALGCEGDAPCVAACRDGASEPARAAFDDVIACVVCEACVDACAAYGEVCG
jgi:hypothetical protein